VEWYRYQVYKAALAPTDYSSLIESILPTNSKIPLSISFPERLTIQAEGPSLYRPETQEIRACQTKLTVKAPVIDIGM
jgi:hypothetical protein